MICLKCYGQQAREDDLTSGKTDSITLIDEELRIDHMYLIDMLCRSKQFSFTDDETGEVVEFKRIR